MSKKKNPRVTATVNKGQKGRKATPVEEVNGQMPETTTAPEAVAAAPEGTPADAAIPEPTPVETTAPEATTRTTDATVDPRPDAPVAEMPTPETPAPETLAPETLETPELIYEPRPAPESETPAGPTLRLWQVRRGPEPVGRIQAGTEEWALKTARREFGDDAVVEPIGQAPTTQQPAARTRKPAGERRPKDPGKLSAIDAAAKVLANAGTPMTCKELIGAMAERGLWTSPGGKTPDATLYSAILREISTKGDAARFVKTERGRFATKA